MLAHDVRDAPVGGVAVKRWEELGGGVDNIVGRGLLEDDARLRAHRLELDDVPGEPCLVLFWLARGARPLPSRLIRKKWREYPGIDRVDSGVGGCLASGLL